ncbi:MAG: regulatory signaling modulator protein AmpE [Gammaproteobacteria bacterium]|nr:regulatory signaling modulator protein AmpE [Gammaproteobacteria bacterium]
MLLLATLIALFAERLAPQLAECRSLVWFDRYAGALSGRLNVPGGLALTVLVAPWALLAVAVQSLLHGVLWGLLELAFSVLILFLALRPGGVDPAIDAYVAAREKGEDGIARHHAEYLLGGAAPQAVEDEVRAVADALLLEANERWVAPLLWFVLLGPLGAVVYRLTAHVEQQSDAESLREAARLLRAALDWLPARLLAGMYILSGSFEEGLNAWRQERQVSVDTPREASAASRARELEQANYDLLLRVGRAALRAEAYSVTTQISEAGDIEADASIVRAARGLVLRSLITFVAIIALLTLGDWIA